MRGGTDLPRIDDRRLRRQHRYLTVATTTPTTTATTTTTNGWPDLKLLYRIGFAGPVRGYGKRWLTRHRQS
jgi:hypothetical protein